MNTYLKEVVRSGILGLTCEQCGSVFCLRCRTVKMLFLLARDLERQYPGRYLGEIEQLRQIATRLLDA